MQVLQSNLPWEYEDSEDISDIFVGRKINDFKVFHSEVRLRVVLELSSTRDPSPSLVCLSALNPYIWESIRDKSFHYVVHAFLSDTESGSVVDIFPKDLEVVAVHRVKRHEKDRHWACSGYVCRGRDISGIQFSFATPGTVQDGSLHRNQSIVLHSWCQCKPIPFCGDPLSPEYIQMSLTSEVIPGSIQQMTQGTLGQPIPFDMDLSSTENSEDVGLLPADFLCSHGPLFNPLDASGMYVLNLESTFRYNKDTFEYVNEGLGMKAGHEDGQIFKFRKNWAPQKNDSFVIIESPQYTQRSTFCLGTNKRTNWLRIFCGAQTEESVLLLGKYSSAFEFFSLPDHLMTSRELNGCLPGGQVSRPKLMCPQQKATDPMKMILEHLFISERGTSAMSCSVRFTCGRESILACARRSGKLDFAASFRSGAQMGCQDKSLGFHLVASSEGRRVCTLHGSVDDLVSDLQGQ